MLNELEIVDFNALPLASIFEKKDCTVGIAGGASPDAFIEYINLDSALKDITFFVIDERDVDEKSDHSNVGSLKRKINRCHKVFSTKAMWKSNWAECNIDLLILGFGEDGHVASIFPDMNYDDLDERNIAF